uniref:pyridoxal-dependent decarboxylase, exosortase A system-associated n=1 Tax=Rhodoferax sp. GW822-FHT02A01 TaxID=3141537 RepID=UPI00406D0B2B
MNAPHTASETPARTATPVHVAMDQFAHAQGELLIGGQRLSQLVARVGQTPFYAYDRGLIAQRIGELRALLPTQVRLHYAMKANPMPALVGWMRSLVDGVDLASAGELKVALDAGVDPRHISFAGPGKRDVELRQAVAAGVLVNVESARELVVLQAASQELGLPARVAVRVNPEFELKSSGMKMGGGAKPFGVDEAQVPGLLADIGRAGLAFEGFHVYAGSQNLQAASICEAQQKTLELVVRLAAHAPSAVKTLNLGGGFGVPYFPGERRLELGPVCSSLADLVVQAQSALPQATLVLELGRYLVAEAGVYVAQVLDRKVSHGQVFLVTDGGMHHHLAASGNFGQVLRKNYPVAIGNRVDESATEVASVVGPLCTPLDLLADRMQLPVAQAGDWVVVYQSGAYGASASPQAFLGHPPCTEVLV